MLRRVFIPRFTAAPRSFTRLLPQMNQRRIHTLEPDAFRERLFGKNRAFHEEMTRDDPNFFKKLEKQQTPKILWIGCSDSRVPANQITGLLPGEVFVHRNIANCVTHADLNCLSVIEYAVNLLKVEHIIVCGHYGCGGIAQALSNSQIGFLTDNWIRPIRELAKYNAHIITREQDPLKRAERLVEVNVRQQVNNVSHTAVVQNAWKKGQKLAVHGWVYSVGDGVLKDLVKPCMTGLNQVGEEFLIV